jgi:hypothetical protein
VSCFTLFLSQLLLACLAGCAYLEVLELFGIQLSIERSAQFTIT